MHLYTCALFNVNAGGLYPQESVTIILTEEGVVYVCVCRREEEDRQKREEEERQRQEEEEMRLAEEARLAEEERLRLAQEAEEVRRKLDEEKKIVEQKAVCIISDMRYHISN